MKVFHKMKFFDLAAKNKSKITKHCNILKSEKFRQLFVPIREALEQFLLGTIERFHSSF